MKDTGSGASADTKPATLEQFTLDALTARLAQLEAAFNNALTRLAKLDQCAGGHDWLALPDSNGLTQSAAHIRLSQSISGVAFAELRFCRRCRGVFWHDVPLEVLR